VIARTSAQEYEFYDSLDGICSAAPDFFIRVHRSFSVNSRFIDRIDAADKTVLMQDGSFIPFSRTYRQGLL